jgi:hypothetical protein
MYGEDQATVSVGVRGRASDPFVAGMIQRVLALRLFQPSVFNQLQFLLSFFHGG